MIKYGIVANPDAALHQQMQGIISHYANKLGKISFSPHLTLHGAITNLEEERVVAKAQQAVAQIKPFQVSTTSVEFGTAFHQCVFVRVKPSAHLFNTHLLLQEVYQQDPYPPYHPHMSLVYGDLDMVTRKKIAQEISLPPDTFLIEELSVIKAEGHDYGNIETVQTINL